MSNCNLFEINIFINVIKRRCDNKKEIKTDEAEEENEKKRSRAVNTRKPTLQKTDGMGSLGDNVEMNILKG